MFEIFFKNSIFDLLSKINKKDHMSKETETDEIQNSFMTSVKYRLNHVKRKEQFK